jgi:hypothetical protein
MTTKATLSDYAIFTNMDANPASSGTESELLLPAEWEELHDSDDSTAVLNDHVSPTDTKNGLHITARVAPY